MKKSLDSSLYNEFADRMCNRVHNDLVSLSTSMIEVGEELKLVLERWTENRRGWVSEEVCSNVKRGRQPNKEYRKMRRVYGMNDERTEKDKDYYFKEKEEAKKIVSSALHAHNKVVMSKIFKNGRKELYNHLKFLMLRGKQRKDVSIKLRSENGLFITEEDGIIFEGERFWGEMFCLNGNANLNIVKVMVDGGMKYGGEHISMTELENAINDMKEKKATEESGLIAGYLKALKDGSKEELRMLLNGVIDGGDIPRQWKESRVVLVYKAGDISELKKYRPIAIINVICKLSMIIVRDRVNRYVEESGMLGDVQGDLRKGRRTEADLFIMGRLIEMTRMRKESLFVAFIDMEKAYDRVDRKHF